MKPCMSPSRENYGATSMEMKSACASRGSESNINDEDFRMFHHKMMRGYGAEIDTTNRGCVKSSKSQ